MVTDSYFCYVMLTRFDFMINAHIVFCICSGKCRLQKAVPFVCFQQGKSCFFKPNLVRVHKKATPIMSYCLLCRQ